MSCSKIGSLRERVIIQQQARVADGQGGFSVTWSTFSTVWAKIEPMSAAQVFWAKHLEHRVTHKITIRTLDNITSDMRISFDSRLFQIQGIRNILEKDAFTELVCEEGAAS